MDIIYHLFRFTYLRHRREWIGYALMVILALFYCGRIVFFCNILICLDVLFNVLVFIFLFYQLHKRFLK